MYYHPLFNSFVPFVPYPLIGDKRMDFSAIAEFLFFWHGDRTKLRGQKNLIFGGKSMGTE
jgi:hypothetical protein